MYKTKNLFIYGTRPELIKLWPVMDKTEDKYIVCTGQHKELLDKSLIKEPDLDLDLMKPGRRLLSTMDLLLGTLSWVLEWRKPERVIVLGDTATAFAAAQAAFHEGYSIAHIEAGLRTHNKNQPFPEEVYRRFISSVADIHFAPTNHAAQQLNNEGIQGKHAPIITGNPVIDAVKILAPKPTRGNDIVVTLHRRESPVQEYGEALANLIETNPRYVFKIIVHPNQQGQLLKSILGPLAGLPNLYFLPPMGYFEFLQLMASCYMVITDSGGLQEEAPTLNKPVIVMREVTERPEGIQVGTAILAPPEHLVKIAEELMYVCTTYERMARAENPFGDGKASGRIAEVLND
jgi:UDP-N-acetylglucosamine 2-epimerase (non-hydrolysing)